MKATDAFLVAFLSTLVIANALPADIEKPAGWNDPTGVQLTSYNQVYAALVSGIHVRDYMDIATCSVISGKSKFNYGGMIDPFEGINNLFSPPLIQFLSQEITLESRATTVLRENQLFGYGVVTITIWTLNPETFIPYEKARYNCDVNNGTAGSAYFFATTSQPPSLLTSFTDVSSTLRSGSAVLYSVDYGKCDPSLLKLFHGGGSIEFYQEINVASVNHGIQFSENRLTMNPIFGFDTTVVSIHQNGTASFDRRLLTITFTPFLTQSMICVINNGTNNSQSASTPASTPICSLQSLKRRMTRHVCADVVEKPLKTAVERTRVLGEAKAE